MSNEELVCQIQQGINTADNMSMLYNQNVNFIRSVVKKYSYVCQGGYNGVSIIEFDELVNEGYFGLVEAVNRYDPDQANKNDSEKGVYFLTYAAYWIRQVVKRYIDNCGRVIRVPVHTQEKIYKYNQTTSYYLNLYNRTPTPQEYASWIEVSIKEVDRLEQFMFKGSVKSLDEALPGGEDESITLADYVASGEDIERDVVEKVAQEQIHDELWDIVGQVLKDDKKVQIIKWRYIDMLTLEEIGDKCKVNKTAIDQSIRLCLRRLSNNTRTRRLGVELGLFGADKPMNIDRVRRWAMDGNVNWLDDKELKYARRLGWVQDEVRLRQCL